jgi:hypothetical protein
MKNIIIVGCGRSGTSLVAGCFSKAGYNMGDDLLPADSSNLKGYFEDRLVNTINDEIIRKSYPKKREFLGEWIFDDENFLYRNRWLASVSLNVHLYTSKIIEQQIRELCKSPFCYKDPRFSYTLPIWRRYLKDVVFICVFRHPFSTSRSIIKESREFVGLHNLRMDYGVALDIWKSIYRHIIKHSDEGNWLFLHTDQIFDGSGLDKMETFTDTRVDRSFPDKKLITKRNYGKLPKDVEDIYFKLCRLANYDAEKING